MATGGLETNANKILVEKSDPGYQCTPSYSTPGEPYRSRVWEDLRELFQQDHLTDVMLAAEGQSIPCHKVLLAAACKFFHDKFIAHPDSLEHNILNMDDIDFDTLTSIVSFIYGGKIELTMEKTQKLIPASMSLMLPELIDECKRFLEELTKTDTSGCIAVYRVAKANSLEDTAQAAWQVMLEKFQEVTATAAFKEMSETEVKEYIKDKNLNVANDNPVFEALVSWVRHDMYTRKDKFERLLENVNLLHCSLKYLGDVVMEEPLVKTVTCFQHVAKALHQHASSPSLQMGKARGHAYACTRSNCTLLAVSRDRYYIWNQKGSHWVKTSLSRFAKLEESSACLTGDGILFTGGLSSNSEFKQCWKLSLSTLDCTAVSDLKVARCLHQSVFVGGEVYVLGGFSIVNSEEIQSVECLDEKTGPWRVATNMPVALFAHIAVNYKHDIYVFGGGKMIRGLFQGSTKSFALNTVSNTWRRKADMPHVCANGSSAVYRDRIYVMGGRRKCCMSYNPDKDQWQTHSGPREDHSGGSAVVWEDRILLCGGKDTNVIEEYNPHIDGWTDWERTLPQNMQRQGYAVFTVQLMLKDIK